MSRLGRSCWDCVQAILGGDRKTRPPLCELPLRRNQRTNGAHVRSVEDHAPNSRDTPYHQDYFRASDDYDKGHVLSHAQGGLEGGPNYFKQKRSVNQWRSGAGNLWRDIETYLAANAGVFAFVRLIY
jgi:hypothetical protein